MRAKLAAGLALACMVGLSPALSAEARSRFTVRNALNSEVDLYIYYGDDTYCGAHQHHKKLPARKSRTFACSTKSKCQMALFVDDAEVCNSDHNACSKSTIKIKDGARVTLRKSRQNTVFCDFE